MGSDFLRDDEPAARGQKGMTTLLIPPPGLCSIAKDLESTRPNHQFLPADLYYGHEDTAKMCARFIIRLFSCPDVPPVTRGMPAAPSLSHFVAYVLHRTRLPSLVTFYALRLLSRLKSLSPAARGSSGHRLFISALMIALKMVCEGSYTNKSWCDVSQRMFSLRDIHRMEREMCACLKWMLCVGPEDLAAFEIKLSEEHEVASDSALIAGQTTADSLGPSAEYVAHARSSAPERSPPLCFDPMSPASSTCHTPPSTDLTAIATSKNSIHTDST